MTREHRRIALWTLLFCLLYGVIMWELAWLP
jgi:hypothetical protein